MKISCDKKPIIRICLLFAAEWLLCHAACGQERPFDAGNGQDSSAAVRLNGTERVVVFNAVTEHVVESAAYRADSVSLRRTPIPAKATIMSAVLPGLGQIYNRRIWKVPLVYAAIGASTYFLIRYQNDYQRYRRAYIDFKDGDPYTNFHEKLYIPAAYDKERYLTAYKDASRRNRDWFIIAVVVSYLMNVVDANVDAHLFNYNVDDNLSLNARPCFFKDIAYSPKIGLNLQFTF
ncbi:MAG: DUF5683 domain-containing protein [Bacteroidales bacterium]|jgi:hypothetical protein|nr:DUF5683 domain-containing protein [Bacteroidales bacterium]